MREIVLNNKYVAHNYIPEIGDVTCFCTYDMTSCGTLCVTYFMPKYGFAVDWHRDNRVMLNRVVETLDGKNTKVTFLVHPTYYAGDSFDTYTENIYWAMDKIFTERLRYLEPEKYVKKYKVNK